MVQETKNKIENKPRVKKIRTDLGSGRIGVCMTDRGYMSESSPALQNKLVVRQHRVGFPE